MYEMHRLLSAVEHGLLQASQSMPLTSFMLTIAAADIIDPNCVSTSRKVESHTIDTML